MSRREMSFSRTTCLPFFVFVLVQAIKATSGGIMEANKTISDVLVETNTKTSDTFCHQIKSKGDNLLYCNLTTKWVPRISKTGLTTISTILSVISGVSTLYILIKITPVFYRNYKNVASFPSCVCCFPCYVIIPVLKLMWDGIDIMLDAYTFHQIETGKLIDPVIYRNTNVVNAMLVFTILGIVKLFFNMWILLKCSDYFAISRKEDLANIKRATILVAFLLEDSIELFLEYFWIEKYFTHNPPFYLIARDILIATIIICTMITDLLELRKEENSKYQKGLYAVMVIIGLTELLRVASATRQLTSLKLDQSCFSVREGRLIQTPFEKNCLENVEYGLLIVGCLALLSSLYVFLIPQRLLAIKSDENELVKKDEKTSMKDKLKNLYNSVTT